MEQTELERVAEAILFAAGEPVELERIAMAAECDPDEAEQAVRSLMDRLSYERRGIRILRLEHAYQMCSSGEMSSYVTRALETRKPPRLSSAQLETLTVIAYYQPATRAYIEQIRGVDSAYSVGALLNKHLIEECGRLNVPGRPILYRTTPDFLRTFGLESLDELPEIEKCSSANRNCRSRRRKQNHESECFGASRRLYGEGARDGRCQHRCRYAHFHGRRHDAHPDLQDQLCHGFRRQRPQAEGSRLCTPVRRRCGLRREDRPGCLSGAAGRAGAYAPDH